MFIFKCSKVTWDLLLDLNFPYEANFLDIWKLIIPKICLGKQFTDGMSFMPLLHEAITESSDKMANYRITNRSSSAHQKDGRRHVWARLLKAARWQRASTRTADEYS